MTSAEGQRLMLCNGLAVPHMGAVVVGWDAFHRVPLVANHFGDAVERVPTCTITIL